MSKLETPNLCCIKGCKLRPVSRVHGKHLCKAHAVALLIAGASILAAKWIEAALNE